MANKILLKKSAVENNKPDSNVLDYGEIALNYHDGNIYYKNTDDQIAEFKRLDSRLNETNVTDMTYDVDGNLTQVNYETGNIVKLYYHTTTTVDYDEGDLHYAEYYAVDSITALFTQTLNYTNKNLTSTNWSAA